jgi:periplasmic divalent cation tolerance protein
MNAGRYGVVLVTAPDQAAAERISKGLLARKLAACVNIVPGLISLYRWEGSVEKDQEVLLIIKTRLALFEELSKQVMKDHPYQNPEVIALPIEIGADPYLKWIESETG